VIVAAVDERHPAGCTGESPGRSEAAEAAPDNYNMR
jgi:hypothetical protein